MNQTDRYFKVLAPEVSGEQQVLSNATGAAAVNYDWVAALGASAPKGPVYLYVEAVTQAVTVRFKNTGAAGTTVNNGVTIPAGASKVFWVDPTLHNIVDNIAGGVGVIKIQVVSKIGARSYQ